MTRHLPAPLLSQAHRSPTVIPAPVDIRLLETPAVLCSLFSVLWPAPARNRQNLTLYVIAPDRFVWYHDCNSLFYHGNMSAWADGRRR